MAILSTILRSQDSGFEALEKDRMGFFEESSEKRSILPAIGTIFFNIQTSISEATQNDKIPEIKLPKFNWGTFESAAENLYGNTDKTYKTINKPYTAIKDPLVSLVKDAATAKPPKPKDPKEEEKKAKESARKRTFFDSLRIFRASKSALVSVRGKLMSRGELNAKLNLSSSYEGAVNDRGEVYAYAATIIEMENSKMEAAQLKKSKESRLAKATGGKAGLSMGQGELLKGGENKSSHFTAVAG